MRFFRATPPPCERMALIVSNGEHFHNQDKAGSIPGPTIVPWYGGVLVPYHLMCLVEGSLLQKCFTGYAQTFGVEMRLGHGNAIVQIKVGTARPNLRKRGMS